MFFKRKIENMQFEKIDLKDLDILSKLIYDYIEEKKEIRHLYQYETDINNFEEIIQNKQKENVNRKVLVAQLKKQYAEIETTSLVQKNIESLSNENTFTVTTAHQLALFTGPLYFIYKTISAIKLSIQLKQKYPQYHFVPIFWLGSEDHDFEEINHLNIYNKKIKWSSSQKGAVGRMQNENIVNLINDLKTILLRNGESEFLNKINNYFSEIDTYSVSFIYMINDLFSKYGLVVLEQDNKEFKKEFIKEFKKELFSSFSYDAIQANLAYLKKAYKVQANPRKINLFYLENQFRERIERVGDEFLLVNSSLKFSKEEMEKELENHPERFSPNVILRPLYQEKILPNLAYVGGAGELAYWLQLKPVFEQVEVNMPMLLLRDMAMLLDRKSAKFLEKNAIDKKSLFKNKDLIISNLILSNSSRELSLLKEFEQLELLYDKVLEKALSVDANLGKSILAEKKKSENSLRNAEVKILRAEKRNQDVLVQRVSKIKDKLFPENKLQERYENFLPYYIQYGEDFFDTLLDAFNPLENEITFFTLD